MKPPNNTETVAPPTAVAVTAATVSHDWLDKLAAKPPTTVLPPEASLEERITCFTQQSEWYPTEKADDIRRLRVPKVWKTLRFGSKHATMLGGLYWVPEAALPANYQHLPWFQVLTLEANVEDGTTRGKRQRDGSFQTFSARWKVWYQKTVGVEKTKYVGVPRFWGLSVFGPPRADRRREGTPLAPEIVFNPLNLKPRPEQRIAMKRISEAMDEWGSAFVEAAPGIGKTFLAIWTICKYGAKAAICVPNNVLVEQWAEAFHKWAPLTRVAILRGSWNPEKDAKHRIVDLGEWDVVVSTAASLSQCVYPAEKLYQAVGMLVVDEAHHIASKTLSNIAPRFATRRVLGLSATPQRRDGLEHALYWMLGPPCFRFQRIPMITGQMHTVEIRRVLLKGGPCEIVLDRTGQMQWTSTVKALTVVPERNRFLIKTVRDFVTAEGRDRVILLTGFRDHVFILANQLETQFVEDGLDIPVATLMGKATDQDRARARTAKVIVGTLQFLEEGYDDDILDTLVLATPRNSQSSLRQVIGRVERAREGKQRPIIVDVVDDFGPFRGAGYRRSKFYAMHKWAINSLTYNLFLETHGDGDDGETSDRSEPSAGDDEDVRDAEAAFES